MLASAAMAALWSQIVAQVWTPLGGLIAALAGIGGFYIVYWWTALTKAKPNETALELGTGFVTNFFDTLGIGSFAPTTAVFKFFKVVPDRLIPGTLNVGHTLPTITQAFIFTLTISVDVTTLILMIAAAVAGAWLGAGIVAAGRSATCRSAWARPWSWPRCCLPGAISSKEAIWPAKGASW